MDGYNISTMLKRLEAATSRLEDLVVYNETRSEPNSFPNTAGQSSNQSVEPVPPMPALSNSTSPRGSVPNQSVTPAIDDTLKQPPAPVNSAGLTALEEVSSKQLAEFVKLSTAIAPAVEKQAKLFESAFVAMINFVRNAQKTPKPAGFEQLVPLLEPLTTEAGKIEPVRDEFRSERSLTNFLATVPAGAGALGWVSMEGKNEGANFIQEMRDSALFYGNRALKDHDDAKPWLKAFMGTLDGLKSAVSSHFNTGVAWAPPGTAVPAAPAPATGGSAPPPPPPPPSVELLTASLDKSAPAPASGAPNSAALGDLFAEISQGESISKGLKPVDRKAAKTNKPPVPKSSKPKVGQSATASTPSKPKKPRVEFNDDKWFVEDLDDRHDIEVSAEMHQAVYITNCNNCTIKILGKAASFTLMSSNKVGIFVENMVATCDVIGCTSFGIQVSGVLPSLAIEQSSQGSIYLSEASLGIEIVTSHTSTLNVNVPEGEPGAYRELPLPEQIVHTVTNTVKSEVVKHG